MIILRVIKTIQLKSLLRKLNKEVANFFSKHATIKKIIHFCFFEQKVGIN